MKFPFCPKCGNSAQPLVMDHQDVSACTNSTCRFVLRPNSKPCASIVVANDLGEILLTTRSIDPDKGKLDLPGGFLQLGEHPYDGARREAREALQVEIETIRVLGFAMDTYGPDGDSTLNIAVLARVESGIPMPTDEISEIVWVNPRNVDHSKLSFTNNSRIIGLYIEYLKSGGIC